MSGYTGEIAGVRFEDGTPVNGDSVENPERAGRAIAGYARRHGLRIEDGRLLVGDADGTETPDPRSLGFLGSGIDRQGTALRDAAVDPHPDDFLPPTNAGEANPHGPEVVAPELHGSQGVRPVKPGRVPDEPDVQEAAEQAHTEDNTEVEAQHPAPAKSAPKADWVAYAVAHGMDPDLAEKATKADLVKVYGAEG